MKKTSALLACAAVALAACTTEPRVTVNSTPTIAAPPPVAVVTPAPTVVLGAPGAFTALDRDFAWNAALSNMFEIGASQIAPKRTSSPDVLSYAGMVNQHHTMAMNELMAIMRARGVGVPGELAPDKQRLMDNFGTSRGYEFDRLFIMEAGVRAHTDAIAMFEQRMAALSDPELRGWAARTLPVMQQHLAEAQRLAAMVG